MVRVHVRPPSFNCRTLCPARVFGKSRERRLPTRLEAGHSAASRQERNSILIPSAAGLGPAALSIKSFFRQEAKLRPPREGSGGKARRAGLAPNLASRLYGRAADALAAAGDEGRGKLRKAPGRRMRPWIRGCPNGATRPPRGGRRRLNP